MSDIPPDRGRDSELIRYLKNIAEGIFHRYGIYFTDAKRAGGWSNATWLANGLALRLSVQQGKEDIRREAKLALLLPPEVGYPLILETGVTDGYEWCLSKKIPGINLGEIWPTLDWDQRIAALHQLWKKVAAVHSVDISAAAELVRKRSLFYAANADEARAGLARLLQYKILSSNQARILEKTLDQFWEILPTSTFVLNHGDFTIENAIWSGGQVVSLIDFEYAMIAPDELDVNELLKFAFTPSNISDPLSDPVNGGVERLQQVVIELAMPMLSHSGSKDLLLGYAIMLEMWVLERQLAYLKKDNMSDLFPLFQILGSLTEENGGYLAPILKIIKN